MENTIAKHEFISEMISGTDLTEIKDELEVLKSDNLYHEFLIDVKLNRNKSENDPTDADFCIKEELAKEGFRDLQDADESSSSSDESVDEEEVEVDDAIDKSRDPDAKNLTCASVKVPPKALKEAAARFPAFWRVNQQFRSTTDTDYKSDEDPDYNPEEGLEGRDAIDLVSLSSSSSCSDDEIQEEGEDISNLIEMTVALGIPSVSNNDEKEDKNSCNIVKSIVKFDDENYKSDEDPDFVPKDVSVDDISSDDDDTKDAEVMQE